MGVIWYKIWSDLWHNKGADPFGQFAELLLGKGPDSDKP